MVDVADRQRLRSSDVIVNTLVVPSTRRLTFGDLANSQWLNFCFWLLQGIICLRQSRPRRPCRRFVKNLRIYTSIHSCKHKTVKLKLTLTLP